jgi:hypothetical protein
LYRYTQVVEVGYVENSDKLYCCQVEVGPGEVRQVVTGLRKYVPEAGRLDACVESSLKPDFHFIGSRVETRRFQASGSSAFNLHRPTSSSSLNPVDP